MSIEQRAPNTTANIHGNVNDVRGDQVNVNLVLNRNVACLRRNTLEETVQSIQELANVVRVDTAKNILVGVSKMLSLWQEHVQNKDNLSALTRSCGDICSTLALATKGASMDRMNKAHRDALGALKSSIDDMHLRVANALQHGRTRRLHNANLDEREISTWCAELDGIFTSFSSKLNISSPIPLGQINELLQQRDVPNLFPDPPPPPPAMFFGRDELLRKVKASLLDGASVALIGPGGIGKSTIAMAALNEEDIIRHYKRRFFVTYETMSQKTITFALFVDRIASVLGFQMSGAQVEQQIKPNRGSSPALPVLERQIKTNLGSSPVLLVLDNAETFEDAVDRNEAVQISDFIAHIANTHGVAVLLTSRTSSNARGVSWAQFDVPPLAKQPARQSFRKTYHEEIRDHEIDGLLAAVDFHPLAISILAHTAKENRWSAKVLLDRWNSQRSELLRTGWGKSNLEFTIKLSLESSSVKELGDDAVRVLWIIAFFPQGINQDHLTRLFPSTPRITFITDALCKASLIYPFGSFLTMLAPIRLFLLDAFPPSGLQLFRDARLFYYSSLQSVTENKDFHANLIISDHLNIEYTIKFDIENPPFDAAAISSACRGFLRGLKWHKPRPTTLSLVFSSLPENSTVEKESKACCLSYLGELYFELSSLLSAEKVYLDASTLFVSVKDYSEAARRASYAALSYNTRGYFSRAQGLVEDFIRSPCWQHIDKESAGKVKIYFILDWSMMHTTSESANQFFVRSMDSSSRGLRSRLHHWQARMYHGCDTPAEVLKHLEPLRAECMSSKPWVRWGFLCAVAEAAFLQRKYDVAMQHLGQAYEFGNSSFRLGMIILTFGAAVASAQGQFGLARFLVQRCIHTFGLVAASSSNDFLRVLYVQGRNELYEGNYSKAHQLLTEVVTNCDAQGDIYTKTLCIRALGETEMRLHPSRKSDSDRYFAQAVELCKESGAPPTLLGVCTPMLKLDDGKFPGWKRFLRAHGG